MLDETPQAARQQASRARRAVEARRPRFPATHDQQREVVEAFSQAALDGDVEALLAILHPDVVFTADGGGVVTASRKPLVGAQRVARAITSLVRKGGADADFGIVDVNGLPGLLGVAGELATVVGFTVDGGRIVAIDVVRNPEKLRLP